MVFRRSRLGTNGILRHPPLRPSLLIQSGHKFVQTLARLPDLPVRYRCIRESQPGGSMRQQTKPFIVERRPTRKPKPDAQKPSIWGRLGGDIAQGLKDERDEDHAVATGGDNRD